MFFWTLAIELKAHLPVWLAELHMSVSVLLACNLQGPSFTGLGLGVCVCVRQWGHFHFFGDFFVVCSTEGLETSHTQPFYQDTGIDVWVVRVLPGLKTFP